MTNDLNEEVGGIILMNFWPESEISDLPKRSFGVKFSTSTPQALTTTLKQRIQSSFFQSCKTRCTGQLMVILPLKSFIPGQMLKKQTWASSRGQVKNRERQMLKLQKTTLTKKS